MTLQAPFYVILILLWDSFNSKIILSMRTIVYYFIVQVQTNHSFWEESGFGVIVIKVITEGSQWSGHIHTKTNQSKQETLRLVPASALDAPQVCLGRTGISGWSLCINSVPQGESNKINDCFFLNAALPRAKFISLNAHTVNSCPLQLRAQQTSATRW